MAMDLLFMNVIVLSASNNIPICARADMIFALLKSDSERSYHTDQMLLPKNPLVANRANLSMSILSIIGTFSSICTGAMDMDMDMDESDWDRDACSESETSTSTSTSSKSKQTSLSYPRTCAMISLTPQRRKLVVPFVTKGCSANEFEYAWAMTWNDMLISTMFKLVFVLVFVR